MDEYKAVSGVYPHRLRSALIGIVAHQVRGHWHGLRSWLRYRPERHYMRGHSR